jgi:hypothetical protein
MRLIASAEPSTKSATSCVTSYINQNVSLARRRVIHVQRVAALRDLISAA